VTDRGQDGVRQNARSAIDVEYCCLSALTCYCRFVPPCNHTTGQEQKCIDGADMFNGQVCNIIVLIRQK
jgi:hypothetical protein